MADQTKYASPQEFDTDLHSVYAAFFGYFEARNIPWFDASWSVYFTTFGDFLGFGWETMVVVDQKSGRAHITVRRTQVAAFAKMIKTRFGESLPKLPSQLPIQPTSRSPRLVRPLSDLAAYRKLSLTLPSAELSSLKSRIRAGLPDDVRRLWARGVTTFAALETTWWDRAAAAGGKGVPLEFGVAVMRCGNLVAQNSWPPVPDENYRKAHYVVGDWLDKRTNSQPANLPRAFAFGESQVVPEKTVERIVNATVSALASPDTESQANTLVLLSLGDVTPQLPTTLALPSNVLVLDVMAFERNLLREAQARAEPSAPTRTHALTSLRALLGVLEIPIPGHAPIHNAGNDAFYTLLAFQRLVDGGVEIPPMLYAQPTFHPPYAPHFPQQLSPSASHQRLSTHTPPSRSPPTSANPSPRQRPMSLGYASGRSATDVVPRRSKPQMQRSQTVFWTEADYASPSGLGSTEPSPRGSLGRNKSRDSPSQTRISWMDLEDPVPSPTTSNEGAATPKSAMKRPQQAPPSAMRIPDGSNGHERGRRRSEGTLVESPSSTHGLTIPRNHSTLGPRRLSNLSSSSSAALTTPPPPAPIPPAPIVQDSGSSGGSGLEIAAPSTKKEKKKKERGLVGAFAKMWTG